MGVFTPDRGTMTDVKIAVMGVGGVGKSAVTIQFVQGVFVTTYDPTIEDSYRKPVDLEDDHCVAEIIDTAGTEQFTAMRELYMKNANGFLLVFSRDSKNSFNELEGLREQILRVKDEDSVPMALAANKCDLPAETHQVSEEQITNLSKQWNVPFFFTSAKTGQNIHEVFHCVIRQIRKKPGQVTQPKKKGKCLL